VPVATHRRRLVEFVEACLLLLFCCFAVGVVDKIGFKKYYARFLCGAVTRYCSGIKFCCESRVSTMGNLR